MITGVVDIACAPHKSLSCVILIQRANASFDPLGSTTKASSAERLTFDRLIIMIYFIVNPSIDPKFSMISSSYRINRCTGQAKIMTRSEYSRFCFYRFFCFVFLILRAVRYPWWHRNRKQTSNFWIELDSIRPWEETDGWNTVFDPTPDSVKAESMASPVIRSHDRYPLAGLACTILSASVACRSIRSVSEVARLFLVKRSPCQYYFCVLFVEQITLWLYLSKCIMRPLLTFSSAAVHCVELLVFNQRAGML